MPNSKVQKRRRWLTYRLSTLFVLTGLSAIAFWWLDAGYSQQAQTVRRIRELGGEVYFDYYYQDPDGDGFYWFDPNRDPPASPWLRAFLEDECFGEVIAVDLGETAANDDTVRNLSIFQKLRWLSLYNTKVTKRSLQELTGLQELRRVVLYRTEIPYAEMKAWKPNHRVYVISEPEKLYWERLIGKTHRMTILKIRTTTPSFYTSPDN